MGEICREKESKEGRYDGKELIRREEGIEKKPYSGKTKGKKKD